MGLFDAAKEFATNPENIAKAKALATDENVDKIAEKLKGLAPEQARGAVDAAAAKAKEWGGPENEGVAEGGRAEAGEAQRDGDRHEGRGEGHTRTEGGTDGEGRGNQGEDRRN